MDQSDIVYIKIIVPVVTGQCGPNRQSLDIVIPAVTGQCGPIRQSLDIVIPAVTGQCGPIRQSQDQRWKNVPACQQCWCKFFPSSGKMCAKFYAVLLQK